MRKCYVGKQTYFKGLTDQELGSLPEICSQNRRPMFMLRNQKVKIAMFMS